MATKSMSMTEVTEISGMWPRLCSIHGPFARLTCDSLHSNAAHCGLGWPARETMGVLLCGRFRFDFVHRSGELALAQLRPDQVSRLQLRGSLDQLSVHIEHERVAPGKSRLGRERREAAVQKLPARALPQQNSFRRSAGSRNQLVGPRSFRGQQSFRLRLQIAGALFQLPALGTQTHPHVVVA